MFLSDAISADDVLDEKHTKNGQFSVKGSQYEIDGIEPVLQIRHNCNKYNNRRECEFVDELDVSAYIDKEVSNIEIDLAKNGNLKTIYQKCLNGKHPQVNADKVVPSRPINYDQSGKTEPTNYGQSGKREPTNYGQSGKREPTKNNVGDQSGKYHSTWSEQSKQLEGGQQKATQVKESQQIVKFCPCWSQKSEDKKGGLQKTGQIDETQQNIKRDPNWPQKSKDSEYEQPEAYDNQKMFINYPVWFPKYGPTAYAQPTINALYIRPWKYKQVKDIQSNALHHPSWIQKSVHAEDGQQKNKNWPRRPDDQQQMNGRH
ncbi:unnamed protein product [Toxocara canis]|uniref:Uncharacterized protein n=1 Tax=Toxocara canis TaxID=6265 RepID=A0A183TZS2_TOXCA|nr:unnamed protein product [Toxocara canis]